MAQEFSRLSLLKGAVTVAVTAASMSPAVRLAVPKADMFSYIEGNTSSEPISIYFGNHQPTESNGEPNKAVMDQYKSGNLIASLWPQETNRLFTKGLAEATGRGEEYVIVGDSLVPHPGPLEQPTIRWPFFPHPEHFSQQPANTKPESFRVVSAEPLFQFGLHEDYFTGDADKDTIHTLGAYLGLPYNENKLNAGMPAAVVEDVAGLAAGYIVNTVMPHSHNKAVVISRRTALGAGFGAAAAAVIGDTQNSSKIVGAISNPEGQRFATAFANLASEERNTPQDLSIIARTALWYEKADYITKHKELFGDINAIDIFAGSAHNVLAPEIVQSESFRKEAIQTFVMDLLQRANTAIDTMPQFAPLQGRKRELLQIIASSFIHVDIRKVKIPWGYSQFEKELLPSVEHWLCGGQVYGQAENVKNMVVETYRQFAQENGII